ncbi:MAG: Trk system potassium transporter TrkA, partial [Pseudomonadota bacterium]
TLFSVPTKIARIRSQSYLDGSSKDLFSRDGLPIDVMISPEVAVAEAILQRLATPGAVMTSNFAKGKVKILGLDIDADSPLVETALDQISGLFPDLDARVVGIGRGDKVLAPRSNDRLAANDRAFIAVRDTHASRLIGIFNRDDREIRQVVIVGGGNIGLHVARELEKSRAMRVRLIERDEKTASKAVEDLKRAIVIQGDGLDRDVLEEAGASSADFVISTTDDDKANILISKLAKRAGARRTLSLINESDLAALGRDMGIDAVLDPRALTVSQILLRMRRGRILSLQSIEDGDAEVAEGLVLDASLLKGKTLDYDDLPEGITAAAIIRDEQIFFPGPGVRAQTDDRVILFYTRDMTRKVEQFFRLSPDFF